MSPIDRAQALMLDALAEAVEKLEEKMTVREVHASAMDIDIDTLRQEVAALWKAEEKERPGVCRCHALGSVVTGRCSCCDKCPSLLL